MDAIVKYVEPGSAAEEGGIEVGDKLLTVNGKKLKDIFDYKFYTSEELVLLEIEGTDGELYEIEIEKDPYEDLGIEFENSMLDNDRGCSNNCIFCFIDQLPPNMRETMYFKDDDTRLSFLTGNYVTLTNVGYNELSRLVKYKMSPINVSVHATDPELRCFMLGNKKAGDIVDKMKFLLDGGITLNAQIVLVPEVNDGDRLTETLNTLASLGEGLQSVSVVPIGLTKYREGLFKTRPFSAEESKCVIDTIHNLDRKHFAYAADEFYINAGLSFPEHEFYDGFPQLENGVGMCSLLKQEVCDYLEVNGENLTFYLNKKLSEKIFVHIATGRAAYGIIKELADRVSSLCDKLEVTVHPIRNDFFGETVTVSGLTTGQDIEAQLKGKFEEGAILLLPVNMLRAGEETFLDNYTVSGLEDSLKVDISIVEEPGRDFVRKIVSAGGKIDLSDFAEKGDLI
ncbi:MAG: DUF512 domain-containing protein [Ruminococcaceae bacterium]|nr:DUF512 domain-containing protein [Oscillospiraceae bacterium]